MLTFADLVALVGADASTDEKLLSFDGVNSLDRAESSEISFLGNPKYEPQLRETKAGVVLVGVGEWSAPKECLLISVENPSAAFSRVIDYFQNKRSSPASGIQSGAFVDSSATVDPSASIASGAVISEGARVGARTVVAAGVVICSGAQVGDDCHLHPNVTVREDCLIGSRVILQPNAVIGSDGFGFELVDGAHEKVPQVGIVVIEDDVEVGSNTCIDRARFGKTVIGKGTKIDNLVQVAHNVEIGEHCLLVSQSGIAGSSALGNYVTVAAQAGVGGHIEIGDQVVLAARAAAMKSISKPGAYMGMPARPMAKEQRKMAALARVPKMLEEVRSLKKMLENSADE